MSKGRRAALYYFNARWYDPELGRFITEDPARDGMSWYVYCSNNPLAFTDPTGLEIAHGFWCGEPLGWGKDAPQLKLGYNDGFDRLAQGIINLDATRLDLKPGLTLRLWKGVYGPAGPGGEIGFYKGGGDSSDGQSYKLAELNKSLGLMSLTMSLYDRRSGEEIVAYSEDDSMWPNAYKPGHSANVNDIFTINEFKFDTAENAEAFKNLVLDQILRAKEYPFNYGNLFSVERSEDMKSVLLTWGKDVDPEKIRQPKPNPPIPSREEFDRKTAENAMLSPQSTPSP